MKKLALGTIIIVMLMLSGCKDRVANSQIDSSSSLTSSLVSSPNSTPSDYVKKYKDETHKQIKYGKLSFNMDVFHIVSHARSANTEIFKCEIDKGKTDLETHMIIKVRKIEKRNFPDTKSIVSYLSDMFPNYEEIRIYNNVIDASGIISLYSVTGGGLTNYVVCYKNACYLVESDYDILEIYLFKGDPSVNYKVSKLKIECAKSFVTNVNETIYYNEDEIENAKYDILQGKGGTKYSAELSSDNKEHINKFTLKNEKGKKLLTLSTEAPAYEDSIIKFLDVNMDGYADIQFLKEGGTLNSSYELYVWDASAKKFLKVKCAEMLSYFEVYDGYIKNWLKDNESSGVVQELVWKNKNTLIKKMERTYHTD